MIEYLVAAAREPRMAYEFAVATLRGNNDARKLLIREYQIKRDLAYLLAAHPRRLIEQFLSCILASQFHQSMRIAVLSDERVLSERQGGPVDGAELLYVVCRVLRPRCVVETGVGPGVSTAYILKALEDNDFGKLHSIDMPTREQELWKSAFEYRGRTPSPSSALVGLKPSGWLIPEPLRRRWGLRLGLTQQVLPRLLEELGEVDIFIHDSEHTYENMLFEYRSVWPRLREGGICISYDIEWNRAFPDFAGEVNRQAIALPFGGGALVK
jgi:hypothetical protein